MHKSLGEIRAACTPGWTVFQVQQAWQPHLDHLQVNLFSYRDLHLIPRSPDSGLAASNYRALSMIVSYGSQNHLLQSFPLFPPYCIYLVDIFCIFLMKKYKKFE